MKTVNYRGMTFEVEERFKYIATDADGSVWLFEREPEYDHDNYEWLAVRGGNYKCIDITFKCAENSLENI